MLMIDERELDALRNEVRRQLSPARFAHTLGVEEAVSRMALLYCPRQTVMLRAAALLHDLTKEYTVEETRQVLVREGIVLAPDEAATPAVWHAITAPSEIEQTYPAWASPALLSAVRWHTTGRARMTLTDAILYLADVIEEGRTYPACVALREQFWGADPAAMDENERLEHLVRVMTAALQGSCDSLRAKGAMVCADTLSALAYLKEKKTLL